MPPIGIKCFVTRWVRPKARWVKLNSDGCSKGNPGPSGGDSVFRNDEGVVIWAQAEFYDCGSQSNATWRQKLCC